MYLDLILLASPVLFVGVGILIGTGVVDHRDFF